MIREALGALLVLGLLTLLGLGPALLLARSGRRRVYQSLAIAPALGFCAISLLGFPLVRLVAPAGTWAWPITLVLLAISLGLAAYVWRKQRASLTLELRWPRVAIAALWFALCCGILIAPLLVRGIRYTAFRSNPSDAYTAMTLAETLRVADWATIKGGMRLSRDNLGGLQQLAAASPTALYSARSLASPISSAYPAALAWTATLAGVPIYRYYYAFSVLLFLMAILVGWALADELRAGWWPKLFGAAAIGISFWARFVLETDASFEIAGIPLLLLFCYAWLQLEKQPPRLVSLSRLFLAIVGAAVVWVYPPLSIVIVGAGALYYAVGLLRKDVTWRGLASHAVTLLLILFVWAITFQLDVVLRNSWYTLTRVDTESGFAPLALRVILEQGSAAFWGLPRQTVVEALPDLLRAPAMFVMDFYAVFLLLFMCVAGLRVFWAGKDRSERLIATFSLVGFGFLIGFILLGSLKPAGKAFTFSYAFLFLFSLMFDRYNRAYFGLIRHRFVSLIVITWLVLQIGLGAVLPLTNWMGTLIKDTNVKNRDALEMDVILSYLDTYPIENLAVALPDKANWSTIMYTQFALSPYRPYFLSGLLFDNRTDFRNLHFDRLQQPPDYLLLPKKVAGLDYDTLGTKVAENSYVALFKTRSRDLNYYREMEVFFASLEAKDPDFPGLAQE